MDLDDQLADFREKYRREAWRQILDLTQEQQRVQAALAECQAQQQALNQQLLAAQRAPPQVVTVVPPELQARVTSLQSQLAEAQGLYQQAQTRLAQVEAQSAATPAELASLRNQYNQAVSQLNQAQGELASLRQRYDSAQATINEALPKLEQLQVTQGQYQAVAGQAQAQLQAQIEDLKRQNLMLQNAQSQVNQQIQMTQREAQLCRENQATQEAEFKTTLQNLQMKLGQPCGLTDTPEEAASCYQNLSQRYPNLISIPSMPAAPQGIVTEAECRQRGPGWYYNPESGVCSKPQPPAIPPRPAPRQQCDPGYYYSQIQSQCVPQVVPQQPGVPLTPPPFIQETPTQIACRQINGIYDPVFDKCQSQPPPEVFQPQVAPGAAQQVALHQQHQRECEAAHPDAPHEYYYNELTQQCGHIPTCPENYRYNPDLNMCSSILSPNVQPIRTVAPIPYEAVVIPPAPPLGPGFEAPPLGPGFEAPPLGPGFEAPAVQRCLPNQRWVPSIQQCVSAGAAQPAARAPAPVDPLQLIRARENCQRQEPPQAYNVATRQCVPPPQCGPGQSYNFGAGRCIGGFAPQAPRPVQQAGGLQGFAPQAPRPVQQAGGLQGFLGQELQQRIAQYTRAPSIAERPGLPRVESFV
jgi:hypothetical protein